MNRKERRAAAKQARSGRFGSNPDQAEEQVARAIAMVQGESFAEAEALLSEVRRRHPDNVEAKHQLGMLLSRTGRADEGIALVREAIAGRPGEALYWNNLAASCLAVQRVEEAAEAAEKAVGFDPSYAMAWENLGLARRDLRDAAGAAEAFARAAKLGELFGGSLRGWGACLAEIGEHAKAEEILRRLVQAEPEDSEGLALLGQVLEDQGRPGEAREAYAKSLDVDPNQLAAALNYGSLLVKDPGEVDAGLRWLRRSTSIAPRSAPTWRLLASALLNADRVEEAKEAIRQAARFASPGDSEVAALQRRLKGGADGETVGPSATLPGQAPVSIAAGAGLEPVVGKPKPAPVSGDQRGAAFDLTILKIGD